MLKQLLATTSLSLVLVLPAAAQQTQEAPAPDATAPQAAPGAAVAPEQPMPTLAPVDLASVTAEDLVGISVVNANEETLGTVDDALLSSDGKIENLVVSFGGVLGFGAKTVELSLDQVDIKSRGDAPYYAVTDLTPEALEAMPAYEKE